MEKCRLKIKLKATVTETRTSSKVVLLPVTSRDMKRKRGHRKGKQKKPSLVGANEPVLNAVSLNTEDNVGLDGLDTSELDSRMEVEAPALMGSDRPDKLANTDAVVLSDRPVGQSGFGRVKVKLRSSKMLESQRTSSDTHTQSDTDRSSPQIGLQKREVTEKMEDSAISLPEMQLAVSGKLSRKAGSIKIKSSKGLGSSSAIINQTSSPVQVQGERSTALENDNSSMSRDKNQRDSNLPHRDTRYSEQELTAALVVIKKVMKMDAAEPFNVPVDPVALGIPDYFDIIETPMDFGTICSDLEHGIKYMNSEDVLKDVQYIWENCYKYNNKGDYILDLMKRVKKNFTKYWISAGLYSDQPKRINDDRDSVMEGLALENDHVRDKVLEAGGRKTNIMIAKQENVGTSNLSGSESNQVENVAPSSQEKIHVKGSYLKHKSRRRHGINRHKNDCLCAVCVVRRRRKEREGNAQIIEDQIGISDGNLSQEFKQEETSLLENPCGDDTSSNLDNSPDPDDFEEQVEEVKLEIPEQHYSPQQEMQELGDSEMDIQKKSEAETPEHLQLGDESGEEPNPQSRAQVLESVFKIQRNNQNDGKSVQHEEEAAAFQQHDQEMQQVPKESQERCQQTKMYQHLLRRKNPLLLELCGTLFPNNPKSVWGGAHSIIRRQESARSSSAIHMAMAMFTK